MADSTPENAPQSQPEPILGPEGVTQPPTPKDAFQTLLEARKAKLSRGRLKKRFPCPECNSTRTLFARTKGIRWCQYCGAEWQVSTPVPKTRWKNAIAEGTIGDSTSTALRPDTALDKAAPLSVNESGSKRARFGHYQEGTGRKGKGRKRHRVHAKGAAPGNALEETLRQELDQKLAGK